MLFSFRNLYLKLLFALTLCLTTTIVAAQNEPFAIIMDRIQAELQYGLKDEVLTKELSDKLTYLQADGSWSDINYADVQYDPLKRIKTMATAYIRPSNKWYNQAELYANIVKALQNWADLNPKNKNWWYNDIFYPQAIGETLVLMRYAPKQLPQALESKLVQRMERKLRVGDGANTSDEALHYLYRACLNKNTATLDSAAKYLFEPISVSDGKEGVQVDGSYYQHGKQQAIASYGRVFAGNSVNAAFYLRETTYALPKNQLTILVDYLKNTFTKSIRGAFYDFNVRGRGISRKDSLNGNISRMMAKIKMFDPANAAYWEAAEKRTSNQQPATYKITPSHAHYWKSNYTLHLRPNYTFSVQTSSTRTLRTERGNNENILGKFLPDGATNIQRNGSEYSNLMAVWEWDKIPGTTSRDYAGDEGTTINKEWGIVGTTNFTGGLSDGRYGLSVYDLNYDGVVAKKAWFFFDKEVVCLGAGINSNEKENITTTINQAWSRSEVLTSGKDKKWILQDSIGYFFPNGGDLKISNEIQEGNWYHINHFQSKEIESHKVFKLWLNHGVKPQNGSYAYVVIPGTNAVELKNYGAQITILKNTEDIQAVKHIGLDMLQVVFYKAGVLEAKGIRIQVDKPCAIYIKNLATVQPQLFVADPAQQEQQIQVKIKLPGLKMEKSLTCSLPTGANAGATTSFSIK